MEHLQARWAAILLAAGVAAAPGATFVWNGSTSTNWADGANWDLGYAPGGNTGDVVWLNGAGTYRPLNQNIASLNIADVRIETNVSAFAVSGSPITLNRIGVGTNAVRQTYEFRNSIVLKSSTTWLGSDTGWVMLSGVLGETGGSQKLNTPTGAGNVILANTNNTFTGGVNGGNTTRITVFGDGSLGPAPASPVTNFIQEWGSRLVFSNATAGFTTMVIHPNRGVRLTGDSFFELSPNTRVYFDGNIIQDASARALQHDSSASSPSFLVLRGSNSFTKWGGYLRGVTLVAGSDYALAAVTNISNFDGGTLDLNGRGFAGPVAIGSFQNQTGQNDRGALVNSDLTRPVAITGTITTLATGSSMPFGGPGDYTFSGTIVDSGGTATSVPYKKTGGGTLTLQGTNLTQRRLVLFGGGLTLDYKNGSTAQKVSTNGLWAGGTQVRILGNNSASLDVDLGPLVLAVSGSDFALQPGAGGLSVEGGTAALTTVNIRSFTNSTDQVFNFGAKNNGGGTPIIYTSLANTSLPANVTFNQAGWAKVSGGQVVAETDYLVAADATTFQSARHTNNIDLAGSFTAGATTARTLRVTSGSPTLDLSGRLEMGRPSAGSDNGSLGGILVAQGAGTVTITNNTIGIGANSGFYLQQFNTNAPLVIASRLVGGAGSYLYKSGPGEVILLNPTNSYATVATGNRTYVFGGTLTVAAVAPSGVDSSIGQGSNIWLQAGTFKYIGPAQEWNRAIGLRGPGAIDASGTGTLAFTNKGTVVSTMAGNDHALTLSGTSTGRIDGVLTLVQGGMVKDGSGTWILAGQTNTYFGTTVVRGGLLQVDGMLPASSEVTVKTNGTLGGTGTIAGLTTIEAGGRIAPGSSVGTTTFSSALTLAAGSKFTFELAATNASDLVSMPTAALTLSGQQFSDFTFIPLGGFDVGTYKLFDAGAVAGSLGAVTSGTVAGKTATLAIAGDDLVLNVIPEPATPALLGLALLALRLRRPRR